MAHADGQVKVLVDRQEVWEQWTGQVVEDTEWGKRTKDNLEAMEKAVLR